MSTTEEGVAGKGIVDKNKDDTQQQQQSPPSEESSENHSTPKFENNNFLRLGAMEKGRVHPYDNYKYSTPDYYYSVDYPIAEDIRPWHFHPQWNLRSWQASLYASLIEEEIEELTPKREDTLPSQQKK